MAVGTRAGVVLLFRLRTLLATSDEAQSAVAVDNVAEESPVQLAGWLRVSSAPLVAASSDDATGVPPDRSSADVEEDACSSASGLYGMH